MTTTVINKGFGALPVSMEICRKMLLRLHKSESLALTLIHTVGYIQATIHAVGPVLVLALPIVLDL